jgi:release factor glutamine methyltransferase
MPSSPTSRRGGSPKVTDLDPLDLRRIAEACEPRNALTEARYQAMVERRRAGEPLQYVLGSWGFRSLDLLVDRRVLIPRPETEWVVERALRLLPDAHAPATVVDLGTGSGAIALSIAAERPRARVVATDASAAAIAVARANLAGAGRVAVTVELHEGDWWDAVPADLCGEIDLVVTNPPYVSPDDPLPPEVADWEPVVALVPGPTGLEAIDTIVAGAPRWLRPGAWLVCEIGETQGAAASALAEAAGLAEVDVLPDLTGRDRMLVARRPPS